MNSLLDVIKRERPDHLLYVLTKADLKRGQHFLKTQSQSR